MEKGFELICPLCKQAVSKELYEKITGVWAARKAAEKEYREKLKALQAEKRRLKSQFKKDVKAEVVKKAAKYDAKILALKQKNKAAAKQAKEKIRKMLAAAKIKEMAATKKAEAKISHRLKAAQKKELREFSKKAKDLAKIRIEQAQTKADSRINKIVNSKNALSLQLSTQQKKLAELEKSNKELQEQLEKETTPQIEGLLEEKTLLKALQDRYGDDKFQHTGKGGDILQFVHHKKVQIGIIVYECKKVKNFYASHIKQASEAKLKRNGDYGILVTKATKKNYKGFSLEKGVIIVHPAGLLSLVDLLRRQLVVISDLKLTKAQREEAIEKTIRFIESPEFTNKLEAVIQETLDLAESLKKEIDSHKKIWKARGTSYAKIYYQTSEVKDKTAELLSGKKEKEKNKVYPIIEEIKEEKEAT